MCPLVMKNPSISYLIIHIYSLSHYYCSLPSSALFSLIGNLFHLQLYPSIYLIVCPLLLAFILLSPLHSSPLSHSSLNALFPRQKPCLILSTPVSSLSYTLPPLALSRSPTTHSPFLPCSPVDETRRRCVPYTDLCRHLFHPLPLFSPLSSHTHTRTQKGTRRKHEAKCSSE